MPETITVKAFVQLGDTLVEKEMDITPKNYPFVLDGDAIDEKVGDWVMDTIKWGWEPVQ